jgi:hypothetical protein
MVEILKFLAVATFIMKVELRLRRKIFVEIPVTEVKCLRDVKKRKKL